MVHKLHFTEYQDSMHPIVCGYWTLRLDSSLESVVYEQQIPQQKEFYVRVKKVKA